MSARKKSGKRLNVDYTLGGSHSRLLSLPRLFGRAWPACAQHGASMGQCYSSGSSCRAGENMEIQHLEVTYYVAGLLLLCGVAWWQRRPNHTDMSSMTAMRAKLHVHTSVNTSFPPGLRHLRAELWANLYGIDGLLE